MANESTTFSRPNICLNRFAAAFLLVLMAAHFSCNTELQSPIVFNTTIRAPHGISFLFKNSTGQVLNVPKVKVTLVDQQGKVVSSNGAALSAVEILGGVMSIGLSPDAIFSLEKPYVFSIIAQADGFMSSQQTIVITKDAPGYKPVYMTKLDNLPASGLAAVFGDLQNVSSGILTQAETLITQSPQNNVPAMSINLPEGLQFLYDGKPVDKPGPLSFRMLFGIPGDANANQVFPGGFEITDALSEDGTRLADETNPLFFTTGGWFSTEMNIGNQAVDGFSKPVLVDMPIANTVINPATNEPVQAGDEFPIWNLNNNTGTWKRESSVVVEKDTNGGLKVQFPITHLSTWNLDFAGPKCTNPITINYTPTQFTPGAMYLTRMVNQNTGADVSTRLIDFSTPSPLTLLRTPNDASPYQLLVHDGTDPAFPVGWMTNPGSGDFNCSNTNSTLNQVAAGGTCAEIQFQIGTSNIVHCNNSIWYRNDCSVEGTFTFGGILNTSGRATIPDLGVSRCLRLWYLDAATNNQVTLDITIDFGILNGTSDNDPNARVIVNGSAPTTHNVSYNKGTSGTCAYLMTVTIPASAVSISTGAACM